jgi:hypothetical protein
MIRSKASTVLPFCLGLFFLSCISKAEHKTEIKSLRSDDGFAVVELFTSEGCSSCPPADELMAAVQKDFGKDVHILCYHVDYWDRLGWKDRFSDARYTERQNEYASFFNLDGSYTPQAIVNGRTEFVGSNHGKLYNAIKEQLTAKQETKIEADADLSGDKITVHYKSDVSKNELLNFALVQAAAETNVKRGENSGKKLVHVRVVRELKTLANAAKEGTVDFKLPAGLSAKELRLVCFLQNKKNMGINAVTEVEL